MFLVPIEDPKGLKLRLAYAWSRWKFGKVMTPLKVVYARVPGAIGISRAIADFLAGGHRLDPVIALLVTQYIALRNGCDFCVDIGQALARPGAALRAKLAAVGDFASSDAFTPRERAALAFAQEWLDLRYVGGPARDALKGQFSDEEIATLVVVCACENYYNSINHALAIGSDGLCAIADRRKD